MLKRLLHLPLLLILLAIGIWVTKQGFQRVETLRQIERIPRTDINALIPGEANLAGRAQPHAGHQLQGPASGQVCLYYEYRVERQTTDSEGKTRWTMEHAETRFVPFEIADETGTILVEPHEKARVRLKTMHTRTVGDRRFTENRIDPGMPVFAMGMAVPVASAMTLRFDVPGTYVPILSTATEERERGSVGMGSLLLTVAGLVFLSLSMYSFTRLAGIHQTMPYLILVALMIMTTMLIQSDRMIRNDLHVAFERVERESGVRGGVIQRRLERLGVDWDGDWEKLGDVVTAPDAGLSDDVLERVSIHRVNLARSIRRAEVIRSGFPERLIALTMNLDSMPSFSLSAKEMQRMQTLESEFVPSRISDGAGGLLIVLGLIGAAVMGGFGMRRIKTKRWIENIPTVKTTGIVYGMNEVKGEVVIPGDVQPLRGPLSDQECVYYHYNVRERRKSGKKTTWVTIIDERRQIPIVCRDEHGEIHIETDGADIIPATRSRKRRFNKRYTEYRLPVGAPLYALGSAVIDDRAHDRLIMARGEDKRLPFILSNYRDTELVARKAARGFLSLNFGFNAFMLAGFSLAGMMGGFGVLAYMTAALTPIAYLLIFMACVMFNDLVYLRRRCDAMWANIDVALKKRFDLLPQLVAIAGRYLEHEREVQQTAASLRSDRGALEPGEAGSLVHREHAAVQQVAALIEEYPDLKGNQSVSDLMRRTRELEDEVALMREGYNHAVEIYNARLEKVPEVLLASAFHFKPREFFA